MASERHSIKWCRLFIENAEFQDMTLDNSSALRPDKVWVTGKPSFAGRPQIIALGASTGGTQALEVLLAALPVDCPGVVVVQHMPERFTALFARRLNSLCKIEVREAASGDRVKPGCVLIAPGGQHMQVQVSGGAYLVQLNAEAPVNRHRPSVDVLFHSVAEHAGDKAIAAILTGMGGDGAKGLLEIRGRGGRTIAQDEQSCVVYGMPREAARLGAAEQVLPLERIASAIMSLAVCRT